MSNELQTEKNRLNALLRSGKITADDHRSLVAALEKNPGPIQKIFYLAINPFGKISSSSVLIAIGLISIVLMSFIGQKIALHFHGAFDFQIIEEGKSTLSFSQLVIQNLVNLLSMTMAFFIGAVVSKGKNLRALDFLSFLTFARLPYFLFALFLFILGPIFPGLLPRKVDVHDPTAALALAIFAMIFLAWEITLVFSAVKVASGLKGKVLWLNFIFGLAISEALSIVINNLILK